MLSSSRCSQILLKRSYTCLTASFFPVDNKFSVQHSMYMGSVEVPSQGGQVIKIPAGTYEFGANLIDGSVRSCCFRTSARNSLTLLRA
jgi:hypothetical protein